jgi:hypothetical protein
MKKQDIVKAAKHMRKYESLRARADKEYAKAQELLKTPDMFSYTVHGAEDDRWGYTFDIPLVDYLTQWPEAQPRLVTWKSTKGETLSRMVYPSQLVDAGDPAVWVKAETESAVVKTAEEDSDAA